VTRRPTEPPLIVVEGSGDDFDAAVAEVRSAGWQVVPGFAEAPVTAGEVRAGAVDTASDAAAALLAVLGGAGTVIHARTDGDVLDRLVDDLRHVRRVDLRRAGPRPVEPLRPAAVDPDALAILAILAEGRTLGDAAATLGLSRRTADRRLAEAREALGAERTVEAVARARRLGLLV